MRRFFRKPWLYLRRSLAAFYKAGNYTMINHDGVEHAGYLAFLGLLSIFPFLVFFMMIARSVGDMQIGILLVEQISSLLPHEAIKALEPRINELAEGPPQGLVTLSLIGVIWTASSAVEGTRTFLNRAYRVSTPPSYLRRRLFSIVEFFIFTMFLMLAMSLLTIVPVVLHDIEKAFGLHNVIDEHWTYVRLGFALAILFVLIASSYYYLPNLKQNFSRVIPGTLAVIFMWWGCAELFTSYLQEVHTVSIVYGSLAGVIAALIFFYLMALIYIFGAEFNYFFEKMVIRPKLIKPLQK